MTPLERLRLAMSLAHTVPGSEMRLRTGGGDDIVVSRHPAADIDPCAMRRVVVACAQPGNPDLSAHIVDIELGGALSDLGGGVFGTRVGACEQRLIATLLPQEVVADLIDVIGSSTVPPDAMAARLTPDCALGVTMLAVTSNSPCFDHALDDVAAQAAAACFVAELTRSALPVQQDQPSSGGQS